MKHIHTFIAASLLAFGALAFYSCSKNNADIIDPEPTAFDDLAFFQESIVDMDEDGQFLHYSYGQVLYPGDPEHLYIGVENIAEAREYFLSWFAPDVEMREEGDAISCSLTDEEGNAQGTVYFTPGTGSTVADVLVSNGTRIRYFDKLTFILNSAWPYNSAESKYKKFDIVKNITIRYKVIVEEEETHTYVCVREASNGVMPMFVSIGRSTQADLGVSLFEKFRRTAFVPSLGKAQTIGSIMQKDWHLWNKVFAEAGLRDPNSGLWIDHSHMSGVHFYDFIYLYDNKVLGERVGEGVHAWLLKIDWIEDSQLHDGAIIDANGLIK